MPTAMDGRFVKARLLPQLPGDGDRINLTTLHHAASSSRELP
jgi:hypothetical protein